MRSQSALSVLTESEAGMVEVRHFERQYKYGDQIVVKQAVEHIWHMPDGLPDELPPAEQLDIEACMDLVGKVYGYVRKELEFAYRDRKRRLWRHYHNGSAGEQAKNANHFNIKYYEAFFRADIYGTGIDGEAVIEQCRRNIYGRDWKEHRDFSDE